MDKIRDFVEAKLSELKEPEPLPSDFNAYDYSGGNYDDAWDHGNRRGYDAGFYEGRKIILDELISLLPAP